MLRLISSIVGPSASYLTVPPPQRIVGQLDAACVNSLTSRALNMHHTCNTSQTAHIHVDLI